jgi:hypothetical protein
MPWSDEHGPEFAAGFDVAQSKKFKNPYHTLRAT